MQLRNVCLTNQTVTYCSFSCITELYHCFAFNQGTITGRKNVSKILGGSLDPSHPLNDAPGMNGAQHCLLFCLPCSLFRTATSCHGKRGCYTPAKMLLLNTHSTPLHKSYNRVWITNTFSDYWLDMIFKRIISYVLSRPFIKHSTLLNIDSGANLPLWTAF